MSRLSKIPIPLPEGVEIQILEGEVEIKGPKGTIKRGFPKEIALHMEKRQLLLSLESKKESSAMGGLYRSLINNAIVGVSVGFEKQLQLVGVGYRASVKGDTLDLQLGYSHPIQWKIPLDLTVVVEKATLIKISGKDKQLVGQFAANVRSGRPPEPYKGKGVRYVDEYVRRKAGKSAKGK